MTIERIARLFDNCKTEARNFPPTDLYNEGWMLRLILDWFSENRNIEHNLNIPDDARWYSEALLPSAFLARYRGDKLAESWTHADGVIGHFLIGEKSEGDLSIRSEAAHLVVIEAKMFSKLSAGVTNAKYYNQGARNVACIAEVVQRANIPPSMFSRLGFFVLAPEVRIDESVFSKYMDRGSIDDIVSRRVSEYDDQKMNLWYKNWFIPVMEKIQIREISWEEIINFISGKDQNYGEQLSEFYKLCLKYNQYGAKR